MRTFTVAGAASKRCRASLDRRGLGAAPVFSFRIFCGCSGPATQRHDPLRMQQITEPSAGSEADETRPQPEPPRQRSEEALVALDLETALGRQRADPLQREKSEMVAGLDPRQSRFPPPRGEVSEHRSPGAVGDRGDDPSLRRQRADGETQDPSGVRQVFQHVREDEAVDGLGQRRERFLDARRQDLIQPQGGLAGHLRIRLDAHDPPARSAQPFPETAVATAHVDNPLRLLRDEWIELPALVIGRIVIAVEQDPGHQGQVAGGRWPSRREKLPSLSGGGDREARPEIRSGDGDQPAGNDGPSAGLVEGVGTSLGSPALGAGSTPHPRHPPAGSGGVSRAPGRPEGAGGRRQRLDPRIVQHRQDSGDRLRSRGGGTGNHPPAVGLEASGEVAKVGLYDGAGARGAQPQHGRIGEVGAHLRYLLTGSPPAAAVTDPGFGIRPPLRQGNGGTHRGIIGLVFMDLAIILVHYHTPELAAESVRALRSSLDEPALVGLSSDIVVVDNGSDAAGRELLDSLPARRIDPGANLGYGGGVNRGVEESRAERSVALNPDVLVEPGCLARLLAELEDGAAVAGPCFYLDRGRRFRIPPTEPRTRLWELLSCLADRGDPWTPRTRRVWRRHARRHWLAKTPLRSPSLSGALLAFSRSVWETAGPFDEGLRLYFEEDDWLRRVARLGFETRYVPGAEAVHLHGRSTRAETRSAAWFADSRRRFRRRWYGRAFSALLRRLEPGPELCLPWPRRAPTTGGERPVLPVGKGLRWLELSPSPRGFPAVGRAPSASGGDGGSDIWEMPEDLWNELNPGTWRAAWVDERGTELGEASFVKRPQTPSEDP